MGSGNPMGGLHESTTFCPTTALASAGTCRNVFSIAADEEEYDEYARVDYLYFNI